MKNTNLKLIFTNLIVVCLLSGCVATKEITSNKTISHIGDTPIAILTHTASKPAVLYFRPHDNEVTSHTVTIEMLEKHGGKFVELNSKGDRLIEFSLHGDIYRFDPNRIFTPLGARQTLKKYGNYSLEAQNHVDRFASHLIQRFLTDDPIIAVHNNTQGKPLTVKSFLGSKDVLDIHITTARDDDNFFYVTQRRDFETLKSRNFNVVLQDNENVSDDGSISVYCASHGIRYINVEAKEGDVTGQMKMLEALHGILKS